MFPPIRVVLAATLLLTLGSLASASTSPPTGSTLCSRYASPAGSDAGTGSAADPYLTAQWLVDHLAPGESGCLRGGTYNEALTIGRGGLPGRPISLTAAQGEAATVRGRLWVKDSANDVVISDLTLDGRNAADPSPTVNGDRITFLRNDVTNAHTNICFVLGSITGYGAAVDVVISANKIHNCGVIPAQNHHHGIFVENAVRGTIRNNSIYNNADKGILLFPSANGVVIENNVIDGNGTGILIGGSLLQDPWARTSPKNNVIRRNVITNSRRYAVEAYWEWAPPADSNNLVTDNCVWGSGFGAQIQSAEQASQWGRGFDDVANLASDPRYVNRGALDYSLGAGSPCIGKGLLPLSTASSGSSPSPASNAPGLSSPVAPAPGTNSGPASSFAAASSSDTGASVPGAAASPAGQGEGSGPAASSQVVPLPVAPPGSGVGEAGGHTSSASVGGRPVRIARIEERGEFTASVPFVEVATGKPVAAGLVQCRAQVNGRRLRVLASSFRADAARCSWRIPEWADGSQLTGVVTIKVGDQGARRLFMRAL